MVAYCVLGAICLYVIFFFQAEDGIRDLVRSRGLGDVYKRQTPTRSAMMTGRLPPRTGLTRPILAGDKVSANPWDCLLYTSDAADERSSVDLGGRRIINKNT